MNDTVREELQSKIAPVSEVINVGIKAAPALRAAAAPALGCSKILKSTGTLRFRSASAVPSVDPSTTTSTSKRGADS